MPTPPAELVETVEAWVVRWARARGVAAATVGVGSFHVRLDTLSRREELVLVSPSPTDVEAVERAHRGDADVWVTVVPPLSRVPRGLSVVEHAEAMMTTVLADGAAPERAGLRREHLHGEGGVVRLAYLVDGEEAAHGVVSVEGEVAVFDRILTEDAHRRRGFGRDVMAALTAEARRLGATRGLLVASRDGQALYGALGWTTVAPVTTYCPVTAD